MGDDYKYKTFSGKITVSHSQQIASQVVVAEPYWITRSLVYSFSNESPPFLVILEV